MDSQTPPPPEGSSYDALKHCVGPSPWYWQTFPRMVSSAGAAFEWIFEKEKMYVALRECGCEDRARVVIGTYVRPFLVDHGLLGLWFPRGNGVFMECFDLDKLGEFKIKRIGPIEHNVATPFYLQGTSECAVQFAIPATHVVQRVSFPREFSSIEELLLIAGSPGHDQSKPAATLLSIRPRQGELESFPQLWFTGTKFDLGYQWLTRVTRHPQTNRIIGDGIRIRPFVLAEDNMNIESWLG